MKMAESFVQVENPVGKGEIACYGCFQEPCTANQGLFGKGLKYETRAPHNNMKSTVFNHKSCAGSCLNCHYNTTGQRCDKCLDGFVGDPSKNISCVPMKGMYHISAMFGRL